jgi:DNA-binding XRE family transcriptional regulator
MPRRKANDKDRAASKVLAEEMISFRKENLFNQKKLAEVLDLSRRTIQMIESGTITPHPSTISAFRDLVDKFKAAKQVTI